MQKVYYPENLKMEVAKLKARYEKGHVTEVSGERLKKLILEISSAKPSDLDVFLLILSDTEMRAVANYIQSNVYGVDDTNLYKLIALSKNFEYFELIYRRWQNHYTRSFDYRKIFSLANEFYVDIRVKYGVTSQYISNWMSNENIASALQLGVLTLCDSISDLYERLNNFGIIKESQLAMHLAQKFFTYCSGSAFENCGDSELCKVLNPLSNELKLSVVYNFLDKVNPSKFGAFVSFAQIAHQQIGDRGSMRYRRTIGTQSNKVIDAYDRLMNLFWLNEVLGTDYSRLYFWKKYINHFIGKYYPKHQMILMDFGRHYAIEFKNVGPIYIFEKEYFKRHFDGAAMARTTTDLKWLMRHSDYAYSKAHHGMVWKSDTNAALAGICGVRLKR